ncbi:hypothetical protein MSPP1_000245 [Malassezia sp. CBS 17886]|nr:hypothetical protein MSPP1_000245 [Malassezia sp. CBS 17886]
MTDPSGRRHGTDIGSSKRLGYRFSPKRPLSQAEPLSPVVHVLALTVLIPVTLIAIALLPINLMWSLVPVVGLPALTASILLITIILYGVPWIAYLLIAQQDRPPYSTFGPPSIARLVPFLPLAPVRCLKVIKATSQYLRACAGFTKIAYYWVLKYVHVSRMQANAIPICDSIPYAIPFSRQKLDVYPACAPATPQSDESNEPYGLGIQCGAPVLVFVPTTVPPVAVTSCRKAYLQLALSLQKLGYCVVVPDISYYPHVRIRQSVIDLRLALSWVGAHISSYGGDPARIHVMGFGMSALLVLLMLVQEAVVLSGTLLMNCAHENGTAPADATKQGAVAATKRPVSLRNLEIYAPQIRLPQLAGVILLAGISDVVKKYRTEMERGVEHLSLLRRFTGPSHAQCMLHSPLHLLMQSHGMLDASFLPRKFLLIHGGRDTVVPLSHSSLLKTQLNAAGIKHVDLRAYRDLGHTETLTCLFAIPTRAQPSYARNILTDIHAFLSNKSNS